MALPNRTASVFVRSNRVHAVIPQRPDESGHYQQGWEIPTIRSMRRPHANRRAALIIEAVIALVLLSTATVALTKLARSSAALGQQSDQRLVATLAAENTIERLRGVGVEELSDQADQVAELVAQDAGCEIVISTAPFTVGDRQGIHVRVDATISPAIRIRLHDWRFAVESKLESNEEETKTKSETTANETSANETTANETTANETTANETTANGGDDA